MVKRLTKEVKKRKKRWIVLIASREFNNLEIGETLCSEPKELIGRVVAVNLGSLIRDPKKQNIRVRFRVNDVKEERASTKIIGYEVLPAYIKRAIRRGRSKIEDSFICQSKDKVRIKIKPLILTRNKTKKSILNDLRKMAREFFVKNVEKINYSDVIGAVVASKFQREIKNYLKKIYPIAICEIKILKRE